jgi:hypothetical protein
VTSPISILGEATAPGAARFSALRQQQPSSQQSGGHDGGAHSVHDGSRHFSTDIEDLNHFNM